jgi:hypothetical protein
MGIFDNDDDFFDNDDFMGRWEKFNNRMLNDEEFKKEMERAQKDFQELIKMLFNKKDFGSPLDFRIIPLNSSYKIPDYKIPEDELDIEKGKAGHHQTAQFLTVLLVGHLILMMILYHLMRLLKDGKKHLVEKEKVVLKKLKT